MAKASNKPDRWLYRRGRWDKRAGLVTFDALIGAALLNDPDLAHMTIHRSKWPGRVWYHVYWRSRFRLADFWASLTMDQRLMVWANMTSAMLSIIAIVISIVALVKGK